MEGVSPAQHSPRRTPSRLATTSSAPRHQRVDTTPHYGRRRVVVGLILVIVVSLVGLAVSSLLPSSTPSGAASSSSTTHPPVATPSHTKTKPAYLPPVVKPLISPTLANEGRWSRRDTWAKGPTPVLYTFYRSNPSDPAIVAYAVWMRSDTTELGLYPGYKGPGPTTLNRGPEEVPTSGRKDLLATFNSGFYEADSAGGFYSNKTLYFPMIKGLATLVEYTNGTIDIQTWTGGSTPPANVLMARQNLHLLVTHKAVDPLTTSLPLESGWGSTLHGAPLVWRSGVGVDAHGNLIYVAAPDQTPESLAQIFVHLGCVRAMQLDINPEWPILATYGGPGAASPALDIPNPNQVATRFLYSSTKDFFALYERNGSTVQIPW